jgi:hypothetical protein
VWCASPFCYIALLCAIAGLRERILLHLLRLQLFAGSKLWTLVIAATPTAPAFGIEIQKDQERKKSLGTQSLGAVCIAEIPCLAVGSLLQFSSCVLSHSFNPPPRLLHSCSCSGICSSSRTNSGSRRLFPRGTNANSLVRASFASDGKHFLKSLFSCGLQRLY